MRVDVSNIKTELVKLNKLIETYEDNYLNLYNELNKASTYWQDVHSINFFDDVDSYKLKLEINVEELNSLCDIYKYLVDQYQKIGDRINFDLDKKNSVVRTIDTYIQEINSIVSSYRSLNLSFCTHYERETLMREMRRLQNYKNILSETKSEVIKKFETIQSIENRVKSKLSELSIEIIKENNVSEYI